VPALAVQRPRISVDVLAADLRDLVGAQTGEGTPWPGSDRSGSASSPCSCSVLIGRGVQRGIRGRGIVAIASAPMLLSASQR
jgi:hypothetical protein